MIAELAFCALVALLALVLLLVALIVLISWIGKKTPEHAFAEVKACLAYNWIGVEGVVDDFISRKVNKIELISKSNKIAIITGGNRGIGKEVLKMLLQCDLQVIMGCRNVDEGEMVGKQIRLEGISSGDLKVYQLDVSSLDSVRQFADIIQRNYTKINYLINNAGIMFAPAKITIDGYESHFATNYLGHFLLTHTLLPLLKAGGDEQQNARIINVSSCVYTYGKIDFEDINRQKMYVSFEAYSQSKLAQIYFTTYLNKLLLDDNAKVQAHAVHPGVVNTDLFELSFVKQHAQWFMNLVFKEPIQGAYPIVYAAISPGLEGNGGTYITNCRTQELSSHIRSCQVEEKLFRFTEDILGLSKYSKIDE